MASTALYLPKGDKLKARMLLKTLFADKIPRHENWRNYYGRALDMQRIEVALLLASDGIMVDIADVLREQMIFDPHWNQLAQKRFGKLKCADYTVAPRLMEGKADRKIALEMTAMVRAKIAGIRNFRQAVYDLAWGYFDNRAAVEVIWSWSGGKFPCSPTSLDWLHPRTLGYGQNRDLRIVDTSNISGWFSEIDTFPLDEPYGKFIAFTPRVFGDYQEREGLGPRSVFWSFFKRFERRQWNDLLRLFALPWRTLSADPNAPVQREDMDDAMADAEALGDHTTAAFAPGVKLDVHWPGSENSGQIFDLAERTIDSQLSRLWLLTDMTGKSPGEAGGGQGGDQAAMAAAQQDLVFEGDGIGLSERFQTLIDAIVVYNVGADYLPYAPTGEFRTKAEKDRLAEQQRFTQAIADGVPVPLSQYREVVGIHEADDDEPVIVRGPAGAMVVYPSGVEPPSWAQVPAAALPPQSQKGNQSSDAQEPDDTDQEEEAVQAAQDGAPRLFAAQPDLGHGSPDAIVERGLRDGARLAEGWATALISSVEGQSDAPAIHRALENAAEQLDLDPIASSLERTLVRGLMLGALDSAWEAEREGGSRGLVATMGAPLLLGAEPGFITKPFQEAIAFFLGKKVLPRREFDRLRAEAKSRAFTIAGQASEVILQTAKDALAAAIQAGSDLSSFGKDLARRFESAGWTRLKPSHVELVFRNGVMGSYAAGTDAQQRQPAVLAARPYWQIRGVDDDRTRAPHRAAHGKVLHHSDAFWSRAPLPWGHNERCRRRSLSQADLTRLGLSVTSGATITGLPDPGWSGSGFR